MIDPSYCLSVGRSVVLSPVRYMSVVVDIKGIVDGKTQNVGWTMVPLFSPDGYALSKAF